MEDFEKVRKIIESCKPHQLEVVRNTIEQFKLKHKDLSLYNLLINYLQNKIVSFEEEMQSYETTTN